MKKIKVYIHEKIDCMCLYDNKRCDRPCDPQIVYYDEFQDLLECFMNKGKKDYE